MTLVVKLGSSIVAADDGSLRVGVLDSVCAQASALRRAGEPLVMVTSGSIARGIRILGLEARPRAIDELQAASAVGQGALFREYETRLEQGEAAAAQVLLTAADVASRTSYLYARQTLRRLLEWGVIPVINENDTTATDEITFGDNDFLAAQVAIMLEARLLVLLTNTDGVYTGRPRSRIPMPADRAGRATSTISPTRTSATAPRSSAAAACAARSRRPRWPRSRGSRSGSATARSTAPWRGRQPAKRPGTAFASHGSPASSFKLWLRYAKPSSGRIVVDDGAASVLQQEWLQPASGRGDRGRRPLRGRGRGRGRRPRRAWSAKASPATRPTRSSGSRE